MLWAMKYFYWSLPLHIVYIQCLKINTRCILNLVPWLWLYVYISNFVSIYLNCTGTRLLYKDEWCYLKSRWLPCQKMWKGRGLDEPSNLTRCRQWTLHAGSSKPMGCTQCMLIHPLTIPTPLLRSERLWKGRGVGR